jgi:hypothetical protein
MLKLPRHEASLSITHNQHKDYYQRVEELYSDDRFADSWISDLQKQKAIANQDVWEMQWYPDTPIGFYHILGADLDALLEYAANVKD